MCPAMVVVGAIKEVLIAAVLLDRRGLVIFKAYVPRGGRKRGLASRNLLALWRFLVVSEGA
jgi:hypothetical protein